jgi:hypothetical protein
MPMVTPSPKDLCGPTLGLVALLALACSHTDPFDTPPYGTNEPFDPGPPARLTLNAGPDRGPSWLPDGSGIVYSSQQLTRADGDVCLAELPPTGGTQRRLLCDLPPALAGERNAAQWPVASPDGRVAFVQASSPINTSNPSREAIVVGPLLDPAKATEVQSIVSTPGGAQRTVTQLRWQDQNRLVYLDALVGYRQPCLQCPLDTLVTGTAVGLLDVASGGHAPLPGTELASGVAPGASADEVYYTLGGDARVFRRVLSTGDVTVAHDFGALGIARDVHVAAGRLVAVVGGRVSFSVDPVFGPVQWDSGGVVHVVDLASGSDVALDGPGLFRRPSLGPAGDRVVAEGYPLIIVELEDPVTSERRADTTVSRSGDLYLFGAP